MKGKTPLVLPRTLSGGDARARVSLNLRNQVLSLVGRDREGLPRRGPSAILWRETKRVFRRKEKVFRRKERVCRREEGICARRRGL